MEANVKIEKDGLMIPIDIADAITLENLKDVLETLKQELEDVQEGEWMHPDDVAMNHELIPAVEKLIWYFGG